MIEPAETRVMIVDDHEIVRRGTAEIVDRIQGLVVVAEAGSVSEALSRAELANPNVVLAGLQLSDGAGIDLIGQPRILVPESCCIVLTSFDDDAALVESLEVGAATYLLETVAGVEIANVIKTVAAGRTLLDERTVTRPFSKYADPTESLTPTEREILNLIGDGFSNREIGESLGVAEKTVKNHITALLSKMGLQRRTQAAARVASQKAATWRQPSVR